MSCISPEYIGIKGDCTANAKVFIDKLQGINIVNIANAVDGIDVRPRDLILKCSELAIQQVIDDWLGMLKMQYKFNSIVSEYHVIGTGSYLWYGQKDEVLAIEVERRCETRFIQVHVEKFQIAVDRDVEVEFLIKGEFDDVVVTKALKKGRNIIDLPLSETEEKYTIIFSIANFKVGRKERCYFEYVPLCDPCFGDYASCVSVRAGIYEDEKITRFLDFGYDMDIQCRANKCEIFKQVIHEFEMPLLYQTGINYLIHAKNSQRQNAYTRNNEQQIDELILFWMGGTNTETGIKYASQYWKALKNSTDRTFSAIGLMAGNVITQNSEILVINSLP